MIRYESIKAVSDLVRGDIVQSVKSGESYVVETHIKSDIAIALKTVMVTDPTGWRKVVWEKEET